jgi:hypothetical protein
VHHLGACVEIPLHAHQQDLLLVGWLWWSTPSPGCNNFVVCVWWALHVRQGHAPIVKYTRSHALVLPTICVVQILLTAIRDIGASRCWGTIVGVWCIPDCRSKIISSLLTAYEPCQSVLLRMECVYLLLNIIYGSKI